MVGFHVLLGVEEVNYPCRGELGYEMASEPAMDALKRAYDELVSAYGADHDGPTADLYAHLRIARLLADAEPRGPPAGFPGPQPEPPTLGGRTAELESMLAEATLDVGPDPLGRLYEATRSGDDRRTFGQFYTPRTVASAAADWALSGSGPEPRVLDPGAGSGAFLLAARDAIGTDPDGDARFVAVDVKRIPLELARLRFTIDGDEPSLRAINASFFDLDPDRAPPAGSMLGDAPEGGPIGRFDAVLGNPPFVRAEELSADAGHYRSHLASFGDGTAYLDGDKAIGRRSDAYVYFVTQATRFLRDGGRLAFVLPTKWLMSGYGETLQRFLFDHYAIDAVVGLGDAFDDALVDTCLLLATRAPDPASREKATVRFVPAEVGLGPAGVDDGRGVDRVQGDIETGKLDRFLAVPERLLRVEAHTAVVPLESVADVARGVMTGANRFFFVDREDRDRWGLKPGVLAPAVKSLREVDRPAYEPADVDRWLVDVHGIADEDGDADAVRSTLASAGHHGLLDYIDHAESAGWNGGRTCRERAVWFDLGPLPEPDAFVPKLLRERLFVIRNRAGATPSNAIDCVTAAPGVDPDALVAVLNTSLVRAFMEVRGRNEAGMLQLMTYETAGLPIPDPRRFSRAERDDLVAAFDALVRDDVDAQTRLDSVVHDALDLDIDAAEARTTADRLRRKRLET